MVTNTENNINNGFGLISVRERIELLDGELHIRSTPGSGTKLIIFYH